MSEKIKFYVREGSGTVYRLRPGGLEKWSGSAWAEAGEQAYRDFGEGAVDYDEVTAAEAAKRARV